MGFSLFSWENQAQIWPLDREWFLPGHGLVSQHPAQRRVEDRWRSDHPMLLPLGAAPHIVCLGRQPLPTGIEHFGLSDAEGHGESRGGWDLSIQPGQSGEEYFTLDLLYDWPGLLLLLEHFDGVRHLLDQLVLHRPSAEQLQVAHGQIDSGRTATL